MDPHEWTFTVANLGIKRPKGSKSHRAFVTTHSGTDTVPLRTVDDEIIEEDDGLLCAALSPTTNYGRHPSVG